MSLVTQERFKLQKKECDIVWMKKSATMVIVLKADVDNKLLIASKYWCW